MHRERMVPELLVPGSPADLRGTMHVLRETIVSGKEGGSMPLMGLFRTDPPMTAERRKWLNARRDAEKIADADPFFRAMNRRREVYIRWLMQQRMAEK